MRVIDFHNHFYPPEYVEAVVAGPTKIRVTFDAKRNPLLHYPGDYNVLVPGHRDIEVREAALRQADVDMQVLSFTTPGVHVEEPARAAQLARMINDAYARIRREKPARFTALATLPLNDPRASVEELERAATELGIRGAMLFSNVNGVALSDERFFPLYQKADDLNSVLYIHPVQPVGVESMLDYWLMPLLGFTFDTTLAAAKLVFSGVAERYPGIRWVLAHLGGAIPYLAERLDRGYRAFPECRRNICKPPSEYLRLFYYDTVNFDGGALELAIRFAGADHLLAGSDYPHMIGSLDKMTASLRQLDLDAGETAGIMGENAARLLGV
jgi:aminocarboxymuconate-semialdehyde decarboxylase